jgi:hypothetical protein
LADPLVARGLLLVADKYQLDELKVYIWMTKLRGKINQLLFLCLKYTWKYKHNFYV